MIFPLVIAAHLLGDWVVQTDHQAMWKTQKGLSGWLTNQTHMLTYHLTMAAVLLPVWHSWSLATLIGVSWVTHSFIDRRWPVRRLGYLTRSRDFIDQMWGLLVVDQVLHLSILAFLVAGLKGS